MNNSIGKQKIGANKNLINNNKDTFQYRFMAEDQGQKNINNTTFISTPNQALIERTLENENAGSSLESDLIDQSKNEKDNDIIQSINTSNQALIADAKENEFIIDREKLRHIRANYLITEINFIVRFIKAYIKADFEFQVKGTTTLRILLQKQGELQDLILAQEPGIVERYRLIMQKDFYPLCLNFIDKLVQNFGGKEIARNTVFSFTIYRAICLKHYEFSEERNKVLALNLKNSFNGNVIDNFEKLINGAIKNLQEIVCQKYYTLLCPLLDLDMHIDDKARLWLEYLGSSKAYLANLTSDELFKNLDLLGNISKIANAACYIVKLQILIDLLNELKKSPKTLENLKILLEKCEECFNYYEEDKPHYIEWCKVNNCFDSSYNKDYNTVKSYLKQLVNEVAQLKAAASWSTPVTAANNKGKKNQQVKKKKQINSPLRKQKTTVSQAQKKQENIQVITTETPKAEEVKINTNENLLTDHKEIVSNSNNKILENKSEEDSLEDIERETNDLFEAIRQLIEKDRKAKLELKEFKLAQKKKIENKEDKIIIIEKKPEIIKLSTGHQATLNAIFSEEDCHLKLSGSEIENLINALGGRTKPGSKNKINIFWGDSTNKAGSYEITHGGNCDGCLTGGYVERVKKAILVGVQLGCIAKETISYTI